MYVAGTEEYKLDTFCITDCKMFYEMIVLYAGKVSNYFRYYANLVHFLTQPNKNNYFKRLNLFLPSKITAILSLTLIII